ncbi:MAG: hypothetical protein IAF08_13595 [Rhizobacter sp.]|nr:hypothetical protein [Chlorobiales bacterium]
MSKQTLFRSLAAALLMGTVALAGCRNSTSTDQPSAGVQLENRSVNPSLVKVSMSGVETFTLISSADSIYPNPATPSKNFIFGGYADGLGFIKSQDANSAFTAVVNHEDNRCVSRITFDRNLKPLTGEYIMASTQGRWRLCSATLAEPEVHGFGPLFLTAGESDIAARTHRINPFAPAGTGDTVSAFGYWSAENAVPLPKTAYSGKTVIFIGDDDDSPSGGQLAMYVSNTTGDLDNGKVYVLNRNNIIEETGTNGMSKGTAYDVTFKEIANPKTLAPQGMIDAVEALTPIKFGRVEDIDYAKDGAGRTIYFNVTGTSNGTNRSRYGRVYKLTLNSTDPAQGAKLEILMDGDVLAGPRTNTASETSFMNPDNICATQNYLYIQEDPNPYSEYNQGSTQHDAYIYQYNLNTGEVKLVLELDQRRNITSSTDPLAFGAGGSSSHGAWEFGALEDISEKIGVPNTFILCLQTHTWKSNNFEYPDGVINGTVSGRNEGSQLILLKGLPR